jgi:hypothetical protein
VQAGERGFKPASVHLYASKYKYPWQNDTIIKQHW